MALRRDMPIRDPDRVPDADRHATDYRASQGGWVKPPDPPAPTTSTTMKQ
ncbi:hypothetical protein [Streptomyces uncialis]|nr:hypothetical protein [Streptomyces uncialis]